MILSEIDNALSDETMNLASAPRNTTILIVLSSDARNEFMEFMARNRTMQSVHNGIMGCKYRGAILAVTHDEDMQRVSIFTKIKQGKK